MFFSSLFTNNVSASSIISGSAPKKPGKFTQQLRFPALLCQLLEVQSHFQQSEKLPM